MQRRSPPDNPPPFPCFLPEPVEYWHHHDHGGSAGDNFRSPGHRDPDPFEEDVMKTHKIQSISVDEIHRELGKVVWDKVGMARNKEGLEQAIRSIPKIKEKFWKNVSIPGSNKDMNQELEKALRLKDFIELAELMAYDALDRRESCGAHFREEYQTKENEAKRNDKDFKYVAAWGYSSSEKPKLFKEELKYKNVKLKTRSYK